METPGTLNSYFALVDDFFKKSFRDDSVLLLAFKTRQTASPKDKMMREIIPRVEQNTLVPREINGLASASEDDALPSQIPPRSTATNFVAFSPRMVLNHDGSSWGKVKLSCGFEIPKVGNAEQGLILSSDGVVTGITKLKNFVEGLVIGGRIAVNTIAPASEDLSLLKLHYRRNDFYYSTEYQRNGLGSSNLLVDSGTTFLNILAGAGFERQRLSYIEQREGIPDQFDVMYAGVGFTGVDWTIAAKMTRTTDSWNAVRVALMQKLSASTLVACSYHFDMAETRARVAIGFSQGVQLRVPSFLHSTQTILSPSSSRGGSAMPWTVPQNFVVACKAESNGQCAATLRGWFNDSIRWGVVVQKKLLKNDSPLRYGITLSMENE